MDDENKFFSALREKLGAKPRPDFDQKFWRAFDDEFGSTAAASRRPFWRRSFVYFAVAPVALVAVLVSTLYLRAPGPLDAAPIASVEGLELIGELDKFEGLLENYEVFDETAELALSVEDMQRIIRDGAR